MNLKTLLQAICFCSECNWEVTYYKSARLFYVYPDNNKPNEERPCYRFTTEGVEYFSLASLLPSAVPYPLGDFPKA